MLVIFCLCILCHFCVTEMLALFEVLSVCKPTFTFIHTYLCYKQPILLCYRRDKSKRQKHRHLHYNRCISSPVYLYVSAIKLTPGINKSVGLLAERTLKRTRLTDEIQVNFEIFKTSCRLKYLSFHFV